jgi:DNA adenine methylase
MLKSPLRYPGGKTRACKILEEIVKDNFDIEKKFNIISPFFGGESFEFHLYNKYNAGKIIANDKFTPLYLFWKACKENKEELVAELINYLNTITKDKFLEMRSKLNDGKVNDGKVNDGKVNDGKVNDGKVNDGKVNDIQQAIYYFIINRCSFSGSTLSGGFSTESSKKRFTKSSIKRISNLNLEYFDIYNLDFKEFLEKYAINVPNIINNIIFLDPPYYLESKLYGKNGDLHENFNHEELYNTIIKYDKWIMTYNDCPYIRKLIQNIK